MSGLVGEVGESQAEMHTGSKANRPTHAHTPAVQLLQAHHRCRHLAGLCSFPMRGSRGSVVGRRGAKKGGKAWVARKEAVVVEDDG